MGGGSITPFGWCIMSHYVRIICIYIRSIYIYTKMINKNVWGSHLSQYQNKVLWWVGGEGGLRGWESKQTVVQYQIYFGSGFN